MKKILFLPVFTLMTAFCVSSCSLEEPLTSAGDRNLIFGTASGLELYSLSFYEALPTLSTLVCQEGSSCDYGVSKSANSFFVDGAYNAETSTSWGWTALRNINFFIDGIHSDVCRAPQADKDHYEGIARWFRAWFYYEKLTKYGAVPWFDHALKNTEFDKMYKNRDSRETIIDNIIKDLDFAAEHIRTEESIENTRISKNAALALKSRACLFEASWCKYHNVTDGVYTADSLYRLCEDASYKVMSSPGIGLNTDVCEDAYLYNNPSLGAYRSLFYSKKIITKEVILGRAASLADKITGDANWQYNSATYGDCCCISRAFIHTYLKKDGTRFTDQSNYSAKSFIEEFTNRDGRLAQTVKGPDYVMKDGNWKDRRPNIPDGVAVTGYHPIKFVEDATEKNGTNKNENGQPIIRFAEVLLNYAEAKAELGEMTDAIWNQTIGSLRKRAGILEKAGVTSSMPQTIDKYLRSVFYPDIDSPVILEIRRERAIELVYEGFRADDLSRWKEGECYERVPLTGIHFPELNVQYDVNNDGTKDYYFSYDPYSVCPSYAQNKYVQLFPDSSTDQGLRAEANPAGGYDLRFVFARKRKWYSDDRQYLHPIPAQTIREYNNRGYKLDQNPGW